MVHESDYRSLQKSDDPLNVSFDRAMQLLAMPKRGRRSGASAKPLRELGPHPADEQPVNILSGRYGPYVKHGKTNASLPKGVEAEDATMEMAVELLAARIERDRAKKAAKGKKKS